MRPKLLSVLAGGLAAALIGVSAASGAARLDGPGTIRITSTLIKKRHADLGAHGLSAGDQDFYRELLYNKGVTPKPLGHADVICTYTGSQSTNCMGTYFLPEGKITVGGAIGSKLFYEVPVLGGTGVYSNVRGTLTVTSINQAPVKELLVFRLVV